MTFEEWGSTPDHFFDLLNYCELKSMPEWDGWVERINNLLSTMAYEDAMGCYMEDLISLAGLNGEIELALKEQSMKKRIDDVQKDFE